MEGRIVPEESTKRKEKHGEIILIVPKYPNTQKEEYHVLIAENGKVVGGIGKDGDRKDDPSTKDSEPKPTEVEVDATNEPSDYDGGGYGGGGSTGSYGGGSTGKSGRDKDDDEKGGGIIAATGEAIGSLVGGTIGPLGPIIKIGLSLGLVSGLILGYVTSRQEEHGTAIVEGDNAAQEIITDTNLRITDIAKYYVLQGVVIDDPGDLIHAVRYSNKGMLGMKQKETPYEELTKEEKEIVQISTDFQEQQGIIKIGDNIITSGDFSTEKEIEELKKMRDAKAEELRIYQENKEMKDRYYEAAVEEYKKDGGDPVTVHEQEFYEMSEKYELNMETLQMNIEQFDALLYELEHPENRFEEKLAEEGTITHDYTIDFEIFGHEVKLFENSSTEVEKLEYVPEVSIDAKKVSTPTDGAYTIRETAIQETKTINKRFRAWFGVIEKLAKGEDIGDVYIFGIRIHKGKDVHGHESAESSMGDKVGVGEAIEEDIDDR